MLEESTLDRPTLKPEWLTADVETEANSGLSQKEVDKRAKTIEIILKDIL